MKIRVFSDLHLEFTNYRYTHLWMPSNENKDIVLILAGDIGVGTEGQEFILRLCDDYKAVIRICGNHEFYDKDFFDVIKSWQDFDLNGPENFHFLHNECRIIDNVRFLGGTMWTNLNKKDPLAIRYASKTMNDYHCISHDNKLITPKFTLEQHDLFMQFLLEKFNEQFDGPTVVISHHSPGSALKRRGVDGIVESPYFSDLEDLIGSHNKAKLWVHGHTHQNYDYMINETRVICNPYGYHNYAVNPNFDCNLIAEI